MPHSEQPRSIRFYRRITEALQALLIIGLPFVTIRGESVMRFDLSTLQLHLFGATIWMHEFFLVLVATIALTLLVVLGTLLFGRVWCGWLCPQTVIVDITPFMDNRKGKSLPAVALAYLATFCVSVVVAASLIWYFVSPYEFIPAMLKGSLGTTTWSIWIALTIVIFLNYALLRHRWCATVCPYAKMQSVMFDRSTLIIEMNAARSEECINCLKCVRSCPTGIDIRKGLDAACINCAECVDACDSVMAKFKKPGLIGYAFGSGGEGRIGRQNVYLVGSFLAIFLTLFLHLAWTRTGVDVSVLPHMMEPRMTKDNRIINAYVLAVKNTLDIPLDLTVSVDRFDPSLVQSVTEPIHINADTRDKFPLFVRINRSASSVPGTRTIRILITNGTKNIHLEKEANFTIPDEL